MKLHVNMWTFTTACIWKGKLKKWVLSFHVGHGDQAWLAEGIFTCRPTSPAPHLANFNRSLLDNTPDFILYSFLNNLFFLTYCFYHYNS